MNTELLKKLLAAGVSADEAIALASETKGAPEDRVTAVVEQMAKSLNQQPLVDRLSAIEATLGKLTTAMTTIIPNALEAQTTAFDSMQKSLTPLQEQMSKALGQPRATQHTEDGAKLPDEGAKNPDEAPKVDEAALEEMRKSLNTGKEKALAALAEAKTNYLLGSDQASVAFTDINAARSPSELDAICRKYKLAAA